MCICIYETHQKNVMHMYNLLRFTGPIFRLVIYSVLLSCQLSLSMCGGVLVVCVSVCFCVCVGGFIPNSRMAVYLAVPPTCLPHVNLFSLIH